MDTISYEQSTEENMFGIPADAQPAFVRFTCALDNYEPAPRQSETGRMVRYINHTSGETCYELGTHYRMKDMTGAIYIVDDGKTALPYYSAGWSEGKPSPLYPEGRQPAMLLHPFPVNPDGRTRPDNGRVVDFSGWMLGPRRAYHLKVSAE